MSYEAPRSRYLGLHLVLGSLECSVVIPKVRHAHQKHRHHALHRGRHWIAHRVVDTLRCVRIVERQEYYVVSWNDNNKRE